MTPAGRIPKFVPMVYAEVGTPWQEFLGLSVMGTSANDACGLKVYNCMQFYVGLCPYQQYEKGDTNCGVVTF